MSAGRFVDLISKKREGRELETEEIQQMIQEYVCGTIPDYQMSAMLMAIFFRGMSDAELTALTLAMRDSGDRVDLSPIQGIKVDKHSTGGVGDKTTLIVGPIVAACGVPVAKMSGRGLGFTGGTRDKLESIPGFHTEMGEPDFFQKVKDHGICLIGQTANLAPADKMLYALRDVTGTVESIPLIASSIMSKKLAAGSDKIVLDVTVGSGAFVKDIERARELAGCMVSIGRRAGKETVAMLTSMEEPLGFAIGNHLEVIEAIGTLRGEGPEDVRKVCVALAGMMLSLGSEKEDGHKELSYEEGTELAQKTLESGAALEKFKELVKSQGGDVSYIENPDQFEPAACQKDIQAHTDGFLTRMDTERIGISAGILGAGRKTKESVIDYRAGILMRKKIGDPVRKGETIATLCADNTEKIWQASESMENVFVVEPTPVEPPQLIVDILS